MKKAFFSFYIIFLYFISSTFGQSYCIPVINDCSYEHISNVKFAEIDNSTGCGSGYNDFTNLKAHVEPGEEYEISVTIKPYIGGDNYISVFIDWNQNGKLDDAGEEYVLATSISSPGPHKLKIKVPEDAVPGETRMRTMVTYATTPIACYPGDGESEDYTIVVMAPYTWSEKFPLVEYDLPLGWTNLEGYWFIKEPEELPIADGNVAYAQISDESAALLTPVIGPLGEDYIFSAIINSWDYSSPFLPPSAGTVNILLEVTTDEGESFTELATITNDGTAGWKRVTVDLSAYENQSIQLKANINYDGYGLFNIGFDNFYVGPPVVPQVLNPSPAQISPTTATIIWDNPDPHPAGGYEYFFTDVVSFSPTANTAATGTEATNTLTLVDLTPGKSYYFWVRGIGAGEEKGEWSAKLHFTAELDIDRPWSEGFNDSGTPLGWNTKGWTIDSELNIPGSQGNVMYRWLFNQAIDRVGSFTTPNIVDIAPGDELSFNYATQKNGQSVPADAGSGTISVFISTDYGTTYDLIETITNNGQPGWHTFRYPLTDYVEKKVKILIKVDHNSGSYYYGFDDFTIEPGAACLPVSELSASQITPYSAKISWSESAAIGYEYFFSETSTPPTDESSPTAFTTNTFIDFTDLEPGSTYFMWVRTVCDSETKSSWSAPMTFSTIPLHQTPWYEGFLSTNVPQGWETSGWYLYPQFRLPGLTENSLHQNLYSGKPLPSRIFITPAIGEILQGQELSFLYELALEAAPHDPPPANSGNIVMSISKDYGVTFTDVATISNNGVAGAQEFHYLLDDFVDENIRIKFVVRTTGPYYYIGFDDFRIATPEVALNHTDGIIYIKEDGEGDGSSWAEATSHLQEAITLDGVTQVWVAAEEYQPASDQSFIMKEGVKIYGGFPSTRTPDFMGRNWESYTTILRGNGSVVIKNDQNGLSEQAVLDRSEEH